MNQQKTSFLLPPTKMGLIFRIVLAVIVILGIVIQVMSMNGIMPVYSVLFDLIVLFGLVDVMILAIIAIRKRMKTDRSRQVITGVLAIVTFLVFALQFTLLSTMSTVLRSEYAKIDSEHGRYVVLRTFLSVPEGTTLEEITNDGVPEAAAEGTVYNYYCMYEAFPEKMGFFYDQNVETKGMVMAEINMETGATAQLLVDWQEDCARFYIEGGTPEENGELLVYYK